MHTKRQFQIHTIRMNLELEKELKVIIQSELSHGYILSVLETWQQFVEYKTLSAHTALGAILKMY